MTKHTGLTERKQATLQKTTSSGPLSIIIIEDHAILRENLALAQESIEQFTVKGEFEQAGDALTFLRTTPVDVGIIDYSLHDMNGIEFLREALIIVPGREASTSQCWVFVSLPKTDLNMISLVNGMGSIGAPPLRMNLQDHPIRAMLLRYEYLWRISVTPEICQREKGADRQNVAIKTQSRAIT